MNWWPYEKFSVVSTLNLDEIKSRMIEQVTPTSSVIFFEQLTNIYPATFKGYVNADGFKIEPVIVGRNSFIPLIKGKFEATVSGSRVYITMAMHNEISYIMIGVATFLVFAGVMSWLSTLQSGKFDFVSLSPFWMLILVYLMVIYGFNLESNSCRTFLIELLEGEYER